MAKSIKLDIIRDTKKVNQFKLAHIGSAVESYAYLDGKEGKLVFILDVENGLQITEIPNNVNSTSGNDASQLKHSTKETVAKGQVMPTAKKIVAKANLKPAINRTTTFPEDLSSYFKYKGNKCICHPNIATELLFKFTIPAANAVILFEPQTPKTPKNIFLKIGDDKNSIKMVLRNLEQKDTYTIRHMNLQVDSYCIPDSNISIAGRGKIVITLDIQSGMTIKNINANAVRNTPPNIDDGTNMCLDYNDNMVKFILDKDGKQKELEFTLKLLIRYTNILYFKDPEKILSTLSSKPATNKISTFLNYTSLANINDPLSNKMPDNSDSGGPIDYFDMLISNTPSMLGYDGNKAPGSKDSGETLDYFNEPISNEPLTLGTKVGDPPPTSGLLISDSF